ncbi:Putative transporter, NadC family [gamma proteobacterium HdN1]|nr:Putative transporter, NadC family [gamma proteobacterium HdN1]
MAGGWVLDIGLRHACLWGCRSSRIICLSFISGFLMGSTWVRIAICVFLAGFVWSLAPAEPVLAFGLGLFVLIGGLWMTQALPLAVTALLVPLLAALSGLFAPRDVLSSFAHPILFLFMGGFALATALQQQGLDRALAVVVLRLAKGRPLTAVLLLFVLTALLSMWVSNTAVVVIMLPLASGMMQQMQTSEGAGKAAPERAFLMLGLAYSASIGGMGTVVGSPPNAIAAAQANISFVEWMQFGIPMVLLLMPLMVVALYLVLRPRYEGQVTVVSEPFEWTRARRITVAIFLVVGVGWVGGEHLASFLGVKGDVDTVIALLAIALIVVSGVSRWEEIEANIQWGVLLLFGGGLALSQIMDKSGTSRFLAEHLVALLEGAPLVVLFAGVFAFVVFLSELISNTAAAALLVPVLIGVAQALGVSPVIFAMAIAFSASCGFMLPVATPPNTLVYGTGVVAPAQMMKVGFVLNLFCIVAISLVVAVVI